MTTSLRVCARCPTRLSRYNQDELCAPCWEKQRDVRGVRPVKDSTLVKRKMERCPDPCVGSPGDYCTRCRYRVPHDDVGRMRQASVLVLRACAEVIAAMASGLCVVDERIAALPEADQAMVEAQAMALARSIRKRADELEARA